MSDLYLSFPYSCSVCICVCTSKIFGSCAFAPLSSGVGLQYSASPQRTWFALTKGPNGSIFYRGVWKQAERERETLRAHLSHLLPLLRMWHSLRSLLIQKRNLERTLRARDKLLWSAMIGSGLSTWELERSRICLAQPSLDNWNIVNIKVRKKLKRASCV